MRSLRQLLAGVGRALGYAGEVRPREAPAARLLEAQREVARAAVERAAAGERWQRYQRLLGALFECTGLDGLQFYEQLACTLAGGFEMRYAVLAVLEEGEEPRLRTLAVWADGSRGEDYRFAVAGTPCGEVVAGGTFFCPRGAAALFPADERLAGRGIESYLGKPLTSSTGKVLGVVALMHDQPFERPAELESVLEIFAGRAAARLESERLLFEAQSARAEAEAANRARDAFLASVSHELRNPLNTIVSWAHLLRSEHLDPAEVVLGADAIERNARRQAQVIERLLSSSLSADEVPAGVDSAAPPAQAPRGALSGVRALVVEDDREALEALLQLLRSYGAEAQGAVSASDALAVFAEFKPAVLVSDLELPGPSGDELLARLRALPPEAGGQIPAVALTAAVGEESRRRILGAGFHTRLTKPVEPFTLVNLLADLARARA